MLEGSTYICTPVRLLHRIYRYVRTISSERKLPSESLPLTATPHASSTINKRRGTSTIISCWVHLVIEMYANTK